MRSVDEILARARQLSPRELRRLQKELAQLESSSRKAQGSGPYDPLLALTGTGHTDFPDVSTHKGKHLAAAYAPKRARK